MRLRHTGVKGHKFFPDVEREVNCRAIEWALTRHNDALFTTLTFKNETSLPKANRMKNRWLARATQSLRDKGGHRLKSICASEWQKRGVIHYHLMLLGDSVNSLSRKRLENRWESLGGGLARCYNAEEGASIYLSKYTSKTLEGDLEWGGNWTGYNFPASIGRLYAGDPPSLFKVGLN